MKIYKLQPKIQNYAWGSKTLLPRIMGTQEALEPQAELWLGAHPKAPADVETEFGYIPLDKLIAIDPHKYLGSFKHYNRLPFLMKILTAETPLSIQSHPDLKQAQEGFARENSLGIALDAQNRNYKDDNHKPELICALTEFHAMSGFRPILEIINLLQFLEVEKSLIFLNPFIEKPSKENFKKFFKNLMNSENVVVIKAVDNLLETINCKAARSEEEKYLFGWIKKLNEFYPGDVGVFAPILLNLVKLQPGEALYLGAGELHAYLKGAGVEIMANSDNVLRGGLTPKYVDVSELLKILTFNCRKAEIINPISKNRFEKFYQTPANEFELSIINLQFEKYEILSNSAEIIFCLTGNIELRIDEKDYINLKRGESAFISAEQLSYEVKGDGTLFRARSVK